MAPTTVFLESFDSTRATALDRADHPNLAQAQAEALLNLLLGHTIALNNTYAFDSRSALELVEVVLDTRARVRAENPSAARRLDGTSPFLVSWFPVNETVTDFFSACADQLRRFPSVEGRFILSAWQPIDLDRGLREEVAAAFTTGERPVPPACLSNEMRRAFETVVRLENHVRGRGLIRARRPRIGLPDYLRHFREAPREAVERMAEEQGCPPELALDLQGELESKSAGVTNRSVVHAAAARADKYRGDPSLALLLRELVDTLYNATLAESAHAGLGYLSSVPRTDGRVELKQVNALAMGVIAYARAKEHEEEAAQPTSAVRSLSGVFTAAETVPYLEPQPLGRVFRAYWELIADEDTHRAWQDSCARLNGLLARRQPVDNEFRDAWAGHLATLKTAIPGLVADDDRIALGALHHGNAYAKTQQLTDPDEGTLAAALAAGEYLDEIARGVRE